MTHDIIAALAVLGVVGQALAALLLLAGVLWRSLWQVGPSERVSSPSS